MTGPPWKELDRDAFIERLRFLSASGSLGGDYLLADLNEVSSLAYSCAHVNSSFFLFHALLCFGVFKVYSVLFACLPVDVELEWP